MFKPENLTKAVDAKGFSIWHYRANGDASPARNLLGYFPNDCGLKPGDALYIEGDKTTTHHWVSKNDGEDKLAVWLFG